jgi:hypothetical protein
MEKTPEANPTISPLLRKTKVWLAWCALLAAAPQLVTVYAAPAGERHVYAKVFVEGIGVKYGYGYMRDVYLDVVVIPAKTVVEQDSGILFTDGSYKKSLSEIQIHALEFVEPHVKALGFETVSDYQIFLYPGDKDEVHSSMAAVEKFRSRSFAIPSKLSGPKAELHGVWIGESIEAKPPSLDKKTAVLEKKPKVGNAPTLVSPQKTISTTDAANTKAADKKKKKVEEDKKKVLALAKKQAEEEKTKAKDDKKAKQKAEGKVVKEMIFDDSLQERQAQTWCVRIAAQFLKSMETSNNKLISMGNCSCKPAGDSGSLQKEFRCEFPVTYRVPTNNAK